MEEVSEELDSPGRNHRSSEKSVQRSSEKSVSKSGSLINPNAIS